MKKLTKSEMTTEIMAIKETTNESTYKTLMRKTSEKLCAELMICREESKSASIERVLNSDIAFEEVEPMTGISEKAKKAAEACCKSIDKATPAKVSKRVAGVIDSINKEEDAMFEGHPLFDQTTIKTGGKKMKENFVIGSRDCSQWKYGKKVKPAEATAAVEAVKGVKAVEAVAADKEAGIKAVKAVAAIKAVKAQPAKPATNGSIQMYFKAESEECAQEAAARMVDQGMTLDNPDQDGNAVYFDEDHKHYFFSVTHELDRAIRAAFKKCKAKDGYNAPGLALLKEEAKKESNAKKAAEKEASEKAKAEADAKSEPKGNVKTGDSEPEKEEEKTEDGDDEWPS